MGNVNEYAVKKLEDAGIKVIEKVLHEKGGHVVILDSIICIRGKKIWKEEKQLTLRSFEQIINYLADIS